MSMTPLHERRKQRESARERAAAGAGAGTAARARCEYSVPRRAPPGRWKGAVFSWARAGGEYATPSDAEAQRWVGLVAWEYLAEVVLIFTCAPHRHDRRHVNVCVRARKWCSS